MSEALQDVEGVERRLVAVLMAVGALFLAIVYLPDIGHGFIKDDFGWIAAAQGLGSRPWSALAIDASGTFYRPVVTLSFAADHAVYGLNALGYGVTNLLLLVACASVIALLLRELGVSGVASVGAAVVWTMNPHGVSMALLWLSGRTSLLMTLCACGATLLILRRHLAAGLAVLLCAMLSKEDALAVPFIVMACLWARHADRRHMAMAALSMGAVMGVYAALRIPSHALTAASAPAFYQLTWSPGLILDNAVGYLDRSATAFAVFTLVALGAYGVIPRVPRRQQRLLIVALIWFLAGIAITVRVPVRSSLYALFPSVGAAIAFAVLLDLARASRRRGSGDTILQIAFVLVLLAAPIYRARNERWVKPADISHRTLDALRTEQDRLPSTGRITFEDEPVRFANFSDAFGYASTEAVRLSLNRPLEAAIVPSGDRSGQDVEVARFKLESGKVTRTK